MIPVVYRLEFSSVKISLTLKVRHELVSIFCITLRHHSALRKGLRISIYTSLSHIKLTQVF